MPIYLYVDVMDDLLTALVVCKKGESRLLFFGSTPVEACDGIELSESLRGDEPEKMADMFDRVKTSFDFVPLIIRLPYTDKNKEIALVKSGVSHSLIGLSSLPDVLTESSVGQ